MREIFLSYAVVCFDICTTCTLLTTEQLQCYNLPWNIAALGGSPVPNFSVLPQAEGIHLTFDLLWSTLGWGTDAKGGGLSSGEISLFSSVYPLDRCGMIKNWGKICQMAMPCLIIKGAPVPETVGFNLKTFLTQHFLCILLVTLIYTYNRMKTGWLSKTQQP